MIFVNIVGFWIWRVATMSTASIIGQTVNATPASDPTRLVRIADSVSINRCARPDTGRAQNVLFWLALSAPLRPSSRQLRMF